MLTAIGNAVRDDAGNADYTNVPSSTVGFRHRDQQGSTAVVNVDDITVTVKPAADVRRCVRGAWS